MSSANGSTADPARRVTLTDVARDAGVSRSTVSLVLRGSSAPSARAVKTVIQSMAKLGYVYNRTAASLRTQKTHTVGLIIPDIENRFFSQLTVGAEMEFDRAGKSVILANTSESGVRQQKAIAMMLEHNVEGVLVCPVPGTRPRDTRALHGGGVPVVYFVRRIPGLNCRFVGNDNVSGARIAVDHLFDLGHSCIAFVGGYPSTSAYLERVHGYRQAFVHAEKALVESYICPGESSFDGGIKAASTIFALQRPPTAVFCFNDMTALGFMKGAENLDLVPGVDIAVVGFDDIHEAAVWQPPLSTIRSSPESVGCRSAELLLRAIEGASAEDEELLLPVELVQRDSSGAPAKRSAHLE